MEVILLCILEPTKQCEEYSKLWESIVKRSTSHGLQYHKQLPIEDSQRCIRNIVLGIGGWFTGGDWLFGGDIAREEVTDAMKEDKGDAVCQQDDSGV